MKSENLSFQNIITRMVFLLGLIFISNSAYAAPKKDGVSVQDSVKSALKYNPSLQSVQEKYQESLHNIRNAKAGYYPTLGIGGNIGTGMDDSSFTRITDTTSDFTSSGAIGLQASQMLWDGGKTADNVRSQKAYSSASLLSVLDAASSLGYTAIASHMDVIRRRELVILSENNVKEHKIILGLLRSRYNNGLSTLGDFEQGVSRLARAEATLSSHHLGLTTALANYTRVTQQQASKELLPVKNPKYIFNTVNDVRDLSVNHNHAIKSDVAKILGLLGQRDSIRASFSPSFTLTTGPAYTNSNQIGAEYQYTWSTMLNLNWKIYTGGANKAQFEAMSAKVRSARKSLHSRMNLLDEEIKVIFGRTMTAAKQAESYRIAKISSNKSRVNFLKQFKTGKKDLLSVLDAENEYFSAAVSEIISRTDSVLGQYRLLALSGTLLVELDVNESALKIAPQSEEKKGSHRGFLVPSSKFDATDEANIFKKSTLSK